VKIKAESANGWSGAITYSHNGGITYAAMVCSDCTGPTNTTSEIVADGDADGDDMADTHCFNLATCTIVKRPLNCLKVVTDSAGLAAGPMTLYVDSGSGQVQEASGDHASNAVVLDKCYATEIVVNIKAESDNGWAGAITHSYNGGSTYAAMVCSDCTGTKTTSKIVVDGDANSANFANTRCFNGASCMIKPDTTTTTTVYTLQASYADGAAYLGHNGLALGMYENVTTGTKWSIKGIGQTNCTLQVVAALESGESFLSSNGSALRMVSSANTANEKWTIAGLC
jgi:hypothetical protein